MNLGPVSLIWISSVVVHCICCNILELSKHYLSVFVFHVQTCHVLPPLGCNDICQIRIDSNDSTDATRSVNDGNISNHYPGWTRLNPEKFNLTMTFLVNILGRVTHIWVSNLGHLWTDNGLSAVHRVPLYGPILTLYQDINLETNFSAIYIKVRQFSYKKTIFFLSFAKWQPLCLYLNVNLGKRGLSIILIHWGIF